MNFAPLEIQIEAAWMDAAELSPGDSLDLFLIQGVATVGDEMVKRWKLLREFRSGARRIDGTWDRSATLPALREAVYLTLQRMSRA